MAREDPGVEDRMNHAAPDKTFKPDIESDIHSKNDK